MFRRTLSFVVASALGVALVSAAAGAADPKPTVTGPITGGKGEIELLSTTFDPAEFGYEKVEYFIEGTATAYDQAEPFGPDGKWKVKESTAAPYKTRVVVFRPIEADDFNGTVFVEWLNVSSGFEVGPDWVLAHNQIMRSGAAWVGVSAQAVGVQGGQATVGGLPEGGVKASDPERYATLSHPGDAYSYDIFSQAGIAVRGGGDDGPLGGLDVRRVIALGESQSAFRMVTYINAVQPTVDVYDGFLVHSRGAAGAGLGASLGRGVGDPSMPETAAIRTDTKVPVLMVQAETDLTRLGYLAARQPDSKRVRLWEMAGTAHADAYTAGLGFSDVGDGSAESALVDPTKASGGPLSCVSPINSGPSFAIVSAAVRQLEQWVQDGTPPTKAPRLETTDAAEPDIARDEHGNALGGIRTGQVQAPLATIDGTLNDGGTFCSLFGHTVPFDAATVAALYPTEAAYVKAFDTATDAAVKAGFLLEPEAKNYKAAARAITFPPA